MKMIVARTGSKGGNSYALIADDGEILLLDFGCKWIDILRVIDFRVSDVVGALLSHEHGDHLASIRHVEQAGIDIYANTGAFNFIKARYGIYVNILQEKKAVQIGNFKVMPFRVPHTTKDADGTTIPCDNFAYLIFHPEMGKLVYMTDLEFSPVSLKKHRINHLLCEVNYTEGGADRQDMNYEHRIMGHMSFKTFREKILPEVISPELRTVTLCHLSETAADAGEVLSGTKAAVSEHCVVNIARPGLVVELRKEPF